MPDDPDAFIPLSELQPRLLAASDKTAPRNPLAPRVRAALVNPPDPTTSDGSRLTAPLGLGYIASVARTRGFGADLFDFAVDLEPGAALLEAAGLFNGYDVYGFSTYTATFVTTIDMVRLLKARNPNALVVLGGYHATSAWEAVMADFPEVDLLVRNEGEYAFAAILEELASGRRRWDGIASLVWRDEDGTVVANPGTDEVIEQDELPYPAMDLRHQSAPYLPFAHARAAIVKRSVPIVSSRGCPKRCSFCSIIVMSPKWRARSVESLMAEVQYRYAEEPFGHIVFQDANFFVRSRRTLQFARALYDFNPAITWSGTATADHILKHADVLIEVGRLNCAYLEIGIESGNDRSLKRFNKWTTVDVNRRALRLLSRAKIPIGLDFIMFDPEMTMDDIRENAAFLVDNDLAGYWPGDTVFSQLQLYPGTPIREHLGAHESAPFPIHKVPVTRFHDPAVAAFVRAVDGYYNAEYGRTNRAIKTLTTLTNEWLYDVPDAAPAAAMAVQQALACILRMRHLAYRWIEDMLAQVDLIDASADYDAYVARIGLAREHAARADAEHLAAELSRRPELVEVS